MIGFTGTQNGMTPAQFRFVSRFIAGFDAGHEWWFHHGDCIGADHDFHRIVRQVPMLGQVHLHPPENRTKRAFCDFAAISDPKPYLIRNHDIVDDGKELLIATPGEPEEVLRSGTWSTIRYAKKIGRKRLVVNPDGTPNITWTVTS